MAKEAIEIRQLGESLFGIEIAPISDQTSFEYIGENIVFPHRHDHYNCFLMESGYVNGTIDFQNLEIRSPSLLLVLPGQVHELKYAKEITGWVIAFDARFIDQNARMVVEQSFSRIALLHLGDPEKKWFANIFQLIYLTVKEGKSTTFHHQLIQTLINAFFYKTVLIFQSQEDERIQEYSSRRIAIVKTFNQLVKEHFVILKKPADYASRMNITVSYLNDTVKSVTGFPATYYIQHEIFREAQRLLFYTAKSVKEIAFQLGYDDCKYFIRLFTKTIGTSPANFRKNNKSS